MYRAEIGVWHIRRRGVCACCVLPKLLERAKDEIDTRHAHLKKREREKERIARVTIRKKKLASDKRWIKRGGGGVSTHITNGKTLGSDTRGK